MLNNNDFFEKMTKEAMEDLAGGEKGTWREIETNTLFLACVGMVYNRLSHKIAKPLWFFACVAAAGVVWMIISKVFGIG